MNDAMYTWASEVDSSTRDVETLRLDIKDLSKLVEDLVDAVRDLGTARFPERTEDYEILEQGRSLWDLVSRSASNLRNALHNAQTDINDLRRAVEFYRP